MKRFHLKVYGPDKATFKGVIKDPVLSDFSDQLDGGLGQLTFTMPATFDDFDEGGMITLGNHVELWAAGGDLGYTGVRIYGGYISRYSPSISGATESVSVNCLGYASCLAKAPLKIGHVVILQTDTATGLTVTAPAAPTAVNVKYLIEIIMDRYTAEVPSWAVNYGTGTVATTSATFTGEFDGKTIQEALDTAIKASGGTLHWHVGADRVLYVQPKPSTATHTFILGTHFSDISVEKSMENVVNKLLFSNGAQERVKIFKLYTDAASVALYGERWKTVTESSFLDVAQADTYAAGYLAANSVPDVKTSVEILDGAYPIENIQVGDTGRFRGFNPVTAKTFTENMLIVRKTYRFDRVRLELESLQESLTRPTVDLQKRMSVQEARGRLSTYT